MNNYRKTIEELKAECRLKLEKDIASMKAALIREIDYYYHKESKNNKQLKLSDFAESVMKQLDIPRAYKNRLNADLMDVQKKIAEVWKDYFSLSAGANGVSPVRREYEKLLALYKVDFANIEKSTRDIVVKEIRKADATNLGFNALRNNLLGKGLGLGESYTLANTALSQFDNSVQVEFASQAGIKYFLYDGLISPGTRDFCRYHIGKIYTIEQLKKLDNGQGLPVETSLGGHNCQHYLTAVVDGIKQKTENNKKNDYGLTRIEKEYLTDYTKGTFRELNEYLINKKALIKERIPEYLVMSNTISTSLEKLPNYKGVVYRGMRFDETEDYNKFINVIQSSKRLILKGFTSASSSKEVAKKFAVGKLNVMMIINSSKGKDISTYSYKKSENEIIFNKISKFIIQNTKKTKSGLTVIKLEEAND